MFSKFFIERPIFATVISIFLVLVGGLCLVLLPVEKTPDITPPTVVVEAFYPGASADVVAETVATPLEEAVNGVDGMLYISSNSSDGHMSLTVTFEVGVDPDMATVLVQNRVATAEAILPEEVIRQGVTTKKRSSNITMVVSFFSTDDELGELYLSNYLNLQVKDVLSRVPGVGEVMIFGTRDFSMRVWLDPELLRARELTVDDVLAAIREQNVQVAAGQIGAPPSPQDQVFQFTVKTLGRLTDAAEFENVILRTEPGGRLLRLKDVARVELGAENYGFYAKYKGQPSVAMAIYQTPGANALSVAAGVYKALDGLAAAFPEGMKYEVPYNPTLFIREAIREIVITLFFTGGLVVLTMFVFLADWRATLIPAIAIPVSLIATFSVMLALGISINTLSMFGLVLVIGIVVDDAILVTENVVRLIEEEQLSPRDAAIKAMRQVTGPVIATTLVLLSVFIPTVLVGGITSLLYSQFAFTISIATCFSSLNALTLSPALCALFLRPSKEQPGRFFSVFNGMMKSSTASYTNTVKSILRKAFIAMAAFVLMTVVSLLGYAKLPVGFLPDEDEGFIIIIARLPDGASIQRTEKVMAQVESILAQTEGIREYITVGGFSVLQSAPMSNTATVFVRMNAWDQRRDPSLHIQAITTRLQGQFFQIPEAFILALAPSPIPGLGVGGFEVRVQDRAGAGLNALSQFGEDFVFENMKDAVITRLDNSFRTTVPQLYVDVDRVKAKTLDVPLNTIFSTLQTELGSTYVNDFNLYGRTFKVIAQAEAPFRMEASDILDLEVRSRAGRMLPLSAVAQVRHTAGPQTVSHYNLYPATTITGMAQPGYSSGQAMDRVRQILESELPDTMGYEWSGISYQEVQAGKKTTMIFLLAALFAYLFLAAQYESWTIPLAIILVIPLGLLGAVFLTWARFFNNNIYTQIGIVLLIGIVTKVAILLVEFAKQLHDKDGLSIEDAATEAARIRFRPILMTALTTGLGAFPMVIAAGAGAAARQALGTCVFGGVIFATILGVLLIPVFYVVIQRFKERSIAFERKLEDRMHHKHEHS